MAELLNHLRVVSEQRSTLFGFGQVQRAPSNIAGNRVRKDMNRLPTAVYLLTHSFRFRRFWFEPLDGAGP